MAIIHDIIGENFSSLLETAMKVSAWIRDVIRNSFIEISDRQTFSDVMTMIDISGGHPFLAHPG